MSAWGRAELHSKPSVVMATASAFHPPMQGDAARVAAMIAEIRRRGLRVVVVHHHNDDQDYADYEQMAGLCDHLLVYRGEIVRHRAGAEYGIDDWCSVEFADMVVEQCVAWRAVACVAQFVFLSRCLVGLPGWTLRILDADNIFNGRRSRFAEAGIPYDWFSTDVANECIGLRRADWVLAIQARELEAIRALVPERPVLLVPHGICPEDLGPGVDGCMLFVGNRNHLNEMGLRDFVANVLPPLRAAVPNSLLYICGSVAEQIAPQEGVVLVGRVPDLRPLYRRAAAVLNTSLVGTGLMIKTVEAMAYGKCVVSTPSGVLGLEKYSDAYVRCATVADFAGELPILLSDSRLRIRIGRRAIDVARSSFAPGVAFGGLCNLLSDHVQRLQGRR